MATNTLNTRIILKNDTAANWSTSTLVLLSGEIAIESDTRKVKIGDGTNVFKDLKYANLTPEEVQTLIQAANHTHDNKDILDATSASFTTALLNKLNGIANNANNYSLPTASSSTLGGVKIGTNVGISSGVISVANGSTSTKGVVQLTDSTSSTSTTTAATPNSVKSAYDLANTAKTNAATAQTAANNAQATADSKIGSVALASGTNNGTLKLTVDGTATDNIAVKGLGSAAYTASSAYATASQGTKADNAMPKAGGTFTGDVTLNADPTAALGAATKQYVDSQITSKIAASDAMVFKGTLGTNGTITAVPTTGVVRGDTYKIVTAGTYAGSACKVGDLLIAMNSGSVEATTTNWAYVPSGNENITPQMFGAKGDGVTDDSDAIQRAIDSINEEVYGTNVNTKVATSVLLYFPKGKYKITKSLKFKEMHSVDFGNAIIICEFDDYMFISNAYKATYTGGVFIGNKGFKITNDNLDQSNIHLSNMEFKNCDIAIEYNVQSSQITITKCLFDNCLHPIIQYASDSATIENNWFTSPIPVDYDSNFYFRGGKTVFNNNILVPIVGTNNGVETAWIEMKGRELICQNNRFGGESGARTAINLKNKYTNDNQSNVFFENNYFNCIRDEKSCIRLYTFPNTLVVKNNYSGSLIKYVLSITNSQVDSFNSTLEEIISLYTSAATNENPFGDVKFKRFLFDINNNFIMGRTENDYDMINERENEYWFLLENYQKTASKKLLFTSTKTTPRRQLINKSSTSVYGKTIYHLPVFNSGVRITAKFNPNISGSNYKQMRIFEFYNVKYYADSVIDTYILKELTSEDYPSNVEGRLIVGTYDDDKDYFESDLIGNTKKRIALKFIGHDVSDVNINIESL